MAESADAHDSKSCGSNPMEVRPLSRAQNEKRGIITYPSFVFLSAYKNRLWFKYSFSFFELFWNHTYTHQDRINVRPLTKAFKKTFLLSFPSYLFHCPPFKNYS